MTLLLALLLFAAPGAACWILVRALDPVGRLVVAAAGSVVLVAGTAQAMLMLGAWSPGTGLVAVLGLSAALAALGYAHRRRNPAEEPAEAAAGPAPANVTRADIPVRRREDDDDEWLYRD
ncbi:hypothetical protein [Actinomadura macrotermitis]|uniref:Uncharacterized protein n=1 Tax=Actinomadura macrotermitis TaxID=2585200 RepID=A0A7K0BPU9_9ACTN|nr:hypothetical protein [Actinomadura macrotermitis]MQY03195.1 hypothetical protein [Actinomadura macrotermitis]